MAFMGISGKDLKVSASAHAAQKWSDEADPEGVVFKREVDGEEEFETVVVSRLAVECVLPSPKANCSPMITLVGIHRVSVWQRADAPLICLE